MSTSAPVSNDGDPTTDSTDAAACPRGTVITGGSADTETLGALKSADADAEVALTGDPSAPVRVVMPTAAGNLETIGVDALATRRTGNRPELLRSGTAAKPGMGRRPPPCRLFND